MVITVANLFQTFHCGPRQFWSVRHAKHGPATASSSDTELPLLVPLSNACHALIAQRLASQLLPRHSKKHQSTYLFGRSQLQFLLNPMTIRTAMHKDGVG